MRKLLAAMKKEALLLLRDRIGLGILFVMPMVLIFVMTLIQDAAFRTLSEQGIPILLVNEDQDSLGFKIEQGMRNAEICELHTTINGQPAREDQVAEAVRQGKYLIAIVVPEGATDALKSRVSNMLESSLGTSTEAAEVDMKEIRLVIDPVASKSFVTSVTSSLREFITSVKTQLMFETFNEQIGLLVPEGSDYTPAEYDGTLAIGYKEEYASELAGSKTPNAVQHNVPAWTIFAMFFIVIPVVGSVMKEKSEGSVFRFHIIPASYFLQINAKLLVFTLVCMLQFVLMLSIGLLFLPMLGLPVLDLGNSITGIFIVALATSFAASAYGVLVGTLAGTHQQGAILGSLSILILSALGGIWVPAYIMPDTLRSISEFSPLNWSLNGFYSLFLRGEGLAGVWPHVLKLVAFFLVCVGLTTWINQRRTRR